MTPCYEHAQFERDCTDCWRQRVCELERVLDVAEDLASAWKRLPREQVMTSLVSIELARLFKELNEAICALEES